MIMNWVLIIGITLLTVGLAVLLSRIFGGGKSGAADNKDFLLAGGNLGAFVAAGTLCATYWSGYAFVGSVGTGYAFGYNQLLGGACYVPALLVGVLFMAKFLKKKADKMGSLSISQYAGQIHGSATVHALCAISTILLMFVSLMTQFKALGRLLEPLLGIDGDVVALVIGIICILYTMYGGLKTVAYSDIIMAVGMTIGTLLCIFFVFKNMSLGEMTANLRAIDPQLTDPTSGAPYGEFKWGAMMMFPMALFGLIGTPHTATRFLSVKKDIKWWKFGLWCFVFAGLWELLPFVGTFLRAAGVELEVADTAMAFFLNNYTSGIIRAFVAVCVLMAIRSTVDSVLQCIASSFSYDLRYVINKGKGMDDTAKAMRYNRIFVAIIGVAAIGANFFTEPKFLVFMGTLGVGTLEAIMFGPMFVTTFWQGNKYGAIASMLVGGISTGYFLLTDTLMWATASVVGELLAAVVYVVVSLATFKICPRAKIESSIV